MKKMVLTLICSLIVIQSPLMKLLKAQNEGKATDVEIDAIQRHNTWELTDLPVGGKTIEVKWIFKTKIKENGEIGKYKARLKGQEQKVYRLKKALYGLKQAPRACYSRIESYFLKTGNDTTKFTEFKTSMMNEFKIIDLRKMHYFLGVEVKQSMDGIFVG
ncbi:unnamed protein product [Prunus brigantina]